MSRPRGIWPLDMRRLATWRLGLLPFILSFLPLNVLSTDKPEGPSPQGSAVCCNQLPPPKRRPIVPALRALQAICSPLCHFTPIKIVLQTWVVRNLKGISETLFLERFDFSVHDAQKDGVENIDCQLAARGKPRGCTKERIPMPRQRLHTGPAKQHTCPIRPGPELLRQPDVQTFAGWLEPVARLEP